MRGAGVVVAVAVLALGSGTTVRGADAKRTLLGTVQGKGTVEMALPGQPWRPLTGGALVEGMRLRTAAKDSAAVLTLANGDVLGLAEGSSCEVGTSRPPRVRLLDGRLALRLRADSPLVVDAGGAAVRGPAAAPVAVGGQREALLVLHDGTAILRTYQGAFEVAGAGDAAVQVAAGQEATIPAQGAPTVTTVAADSHTAEKAAGGGALAAVGISGTTAGLIGGGVAVVGGAVGGAAASGAFTSGGGSTDTGGSQGSPFRPIRR